MNVETIGCCHFWNYWSIQFKSRSKPWQIAFIQRKPTRWSKQNCKIIEDVPADKPLIWCPRAFLHQNPRTNIDTIEPQLWTRTHHLDVNRRPLEWASQPPVMNGANTWNLSAITGVYKLSMTFLPKAWTMMNFFKTIESSAKMPGTQYYNLPGQTTDWWLLFLLVAMHPC